MKSRVLGSSGIVVSEIGYGSMGLTWAYGRPIDEQHEQDAIALLNRAIDLGVTLFDTADMYGPFTNEELVGKALRNRRSEVVIATKCGLIVHGDRKNYDIRRDGTPAHIRQACDASRKRLGIDVIDLYQLHRVDPNVPVEESVGAMAELVRNGKVRAIGLSEVDVPTLERAMRVHPIASLQSEYSLFERNIEREILPWCEQHNVALLAYSPLGRGMLTGRLQQSDIASDDFRATLPRFQAETFDHNRRIVDRVQAVATRVGATTGQVALAWLLAKSPSVIPIPGTKRIEYLKENVGASSVHLSPADVAELDSLPAPMGERYPEAKPTPR
jgi:aryl-alcohol dehydrogenase-like predicted oxidoreductase